MTSKSYTLNVLVVPANLITSVVTPPSLTVKIISLSSDVCANVISLDDTDTVSSCESPTSIPVSLSIVKAPVVVSAVSALKKLPPAIRVDEEFVVPLTLTNDAEVFVPSNTMPLIVEFNVNPALIVVNPAYVVVSVGVNSSFDKIDTLVPPANIAAMTLSPPELAAVSITNPDCVCPAVKTGPNSSHLSLTWCDLLSPVYTKT